ncbi:MAG: hypothetical protein D6807_03680, partial [Alphaproteobacteria bacterium]
MRCYGTRGNRFWVGMFFGLVLVLSGCDRAPSREGGDGAAGGGSPTSEAAAYRVPANVADVPAPVQPLPYSHKTHAGDLALD